MKSEDIEQLGAIELDAFPELFPPTSFARQFQKPDSAVLVAELDISLTQTVSSEKDLARSAYKGEYTGWHPADIFIAGMLVSTCMVDENHIISLGVRRSYRRIGIGKLLLQSLITATIDNSLQVVTLEVRRSNFEAIELYRKLNFEIVGVRKKYYSNTREDALIMTLSDVKKTNFLHKSI